MFTTEDNTNISDASSQEEAGLTTFCCPVCGLYKARVRQCEFCSEYEPEEANDTPFDDEDDEPCDEPEEVIYKDSPGALDPDEIP